MHYRELATNQRGFLLRSQLTEEEIQEARETGFIINEHLLYTKQGFETQLSGSSTSDTYYWLWLLAFPTIPPEQRNPMPYMAGSAALRIRGIGRIGSGDPMYVITPPELMPYANIEEKAPTNSSSTIISSPPTGPLSMTPQWRIFCPRYGNTS